MEDVWSRKYTINGWNVTGHSIAGYKTSFYISDLDILLDAGYQNFNNPKFIFITHTHADHIASLGLTILENINSDVLSTIYCPIDSFELLDNFLVSFLSCNYNSDFVSKKKDKFYKLIGLSYGESFELVFNKKKFIIEVFKSNHRVPTISYGFNFVTKKLKEEYQNLQGKEIAKLKKEGVEINYELIVPSLLFVGDTDKIFFENTDIFKYKNIIIECTFFDEGEIGMSSERKHMHWIYLSNIIKKFSEINFFIIHISARHIKDYKNYVENYENLRFLYD